MRSGRTDDVGPEEEDVFAHDVVRSIRSLVSVAVAVGVTIDLGMTLFVRGRGGRGGGGIAGLGGLASSLSRRHDGSGSGRGVG